MEEELTKTQRICKKIFKVALINFASFVIISLLLGGDALQGFASDGHYYLKDHGKVKETYAFIWYFSRLHGQSIFITHAFAFLAFIIYRFSKPSHKKKPSS
ncbi:hypothetical protein [Anaerosinus massiliensis]|uniref:hypothetical protein n=1 Tax=Massilibacillus massiliensis TaxID=1806837 RepID=UPI000DA63BEA|nr:hypothetical protein [Massilibacillus massiliensis]